jgi:chromosome segregation ATPase
MATFGKVLAVINVLAAIGFLVFVGMDYSKRQNWAYAHFRGQLAINGLPVDERDETGRLPGRNVASQLGKDAIGELFRGSPGAPRTQVEEVNFRKGQIETEISAAPDLNAKRAVLAKYLLPLAAEGDVRDSFMDRLRKLNDQEVAALTEDLNGYFARAISPQKPSGEERDIEDRRRSIADLLYNLDATPEGRTRTQTVVGMVHYINAADRQYANLRTMSDRLRAAIAAEQKTFIGAYQAVLPELARLDAELKTYDAKLADEQRRVKEHTALRNNRQAEATALQQQLQKTTQDAAAELAALDGYQKRLFELEQEFAKLQAGNQRLEADIRVKETGR